MGANLCGEYSGTQCICECFLFSVTLHDSMSRAVCISGTQTLPQKTKCHPPPPLVLCGAHANQPRRPPGERCSYSFDRRTDGGCRSAVSNLFCTRDVNIILLSRCAPLSPCPTINGGWPRCCHGDARVTDGGGHGGRLSSRTPDPHHTIGKSCKGDLWNMRLVLVD